MQFQFSSLNDFAGMGGHGPYVWICFLVFIAGLSVFHLKTSLIKARLTKSIAHESALREKVKSEINDHASL